MTKNATKKTNSKPTLVRTTEPTRRFFEYYDLPSVVDETQEQLDKLVTLFAYVDGDPEATVRNAERRACFNATAAELASGLELVRDILESLDKSLAIAEERVAGKVVANAQ